MRSERSFGKTVIVAQDGPGFLVNRCGRPFYSESLQLLRERAATHEQIDRIMRMNGFRMGPFELMDLVGIDIGFEVAKSFDAQVFGAEARWKPSPLQARKVAAGTLGRKTGKGWYEYPPGRPDDPEPKGGEIDPAWLERPGVHALPPYGSLVELTPEADADTEALFADFHVERVQEPVLERIVCQLVNEAMFAVGEGVASPEDVDRGVEARAQLSPRASRLGEAGRNESRQVLPGSSRRRALPDRPAAQARMIDTAVVPVAGRGTRLLPATRALPKALLPLVDEPVIDLVLQELAVAGISRVVLVVGEHADVLARHLDGRGDDGIALEWVRQPEPLGLGDAVMRGAEAVGDQPYVVALGDALIEPPGIVSRLIAAFGDGYDAAIAVEDVGPERTSSYGIVDADRSTTGAPVRGIVEKPAPGTAPSTLAVAGRYVLAPGLRAPAPGYGGEIQLTDALAGVRAVAVALADDERRLDVGDPDGYAHAFLARYESRQR